MTLEETMQKIRPVDAAAMAAAKQHWDGLGKPLGSLGRLEKALIQIAGIQRTGDVHIDRKALVIMCADNGVVEEGVTQCGQEVTATVAENFLDEKSCVAIMCRRAGTKSGGYRHDSGHPTGGKTKNRLWNEKYGERACHDKGTGCCSH